MTSVLFFLTAYHPIPHECALHRVDGILCMSRLEIERSEVAGLASFGVVCHRVEVTRLASFYTARRRVGIVMRGVSLG